MSWVATAIVQYNQISLQELVQVLVEGIDSRNKHLPRYVPLVGVSVLLVRPAKWCRRPECLENIDGAVLRKVGIGPRNTGLAALPNITHSIIHLRYGCNQQDVAMLDFSVWIISLVIMEPDVVIIDSQVHVCRRVFKDLVYSFH
jgi:hypothetical protein